MITVISKIPKKFKLENNVFEVDLTYNTDSELENSKKNLYDGVLVTYSDSSTMKAVCIQTNINNDRITSFVKEFYSNGVVNDVVHQGTFKNDSMTADSTSYINLENGLIVTENEATEIINEIRVLKTGYVTEIMYFRLSQTAIQISGYINNGIMSRY